MYICVPDGRLALHGGEAGSKKETCRTHLKRGKKHGTNSAKARHQHGPGATEGTGKVRRPASLHCIPLLNLTRLENEGSGSKIGPPDLGASPERNETIFSSCWLCVENNW